MPANVGQLPPVVPRGQNQGWCQQLSLDVASEGSARYAEFPRSLGRGQQLSHTSDVRGLYGVLDRTCRLWRVCLD